MRSEAFEFPLVREEMKRLPGGRWIDPRVLDDAIGEIAVADLKAAGARGRRDRLDAEIARHEQDGARARARVMALIETAITISPAASPAEMRRTEFD